MMNTSGKFNLNSIYLENHEYLMRCGNISGTREIIKYIYIYIDAGWSKSTRALTKDQQYIFSPNSLILFFCVFFCLLNVPKTYLMTVTFCYNDITQTYRYT